MTTQAADDPKKVGLWEDLFPIDNVAVHASLLPLRNGSKVLCWGRRTNPMSMIDKTMDETKTVSFILDTDTRKCTYTNNQPTQPGTGNEAGKTVEVNLFCSGHCFQTDGSLLVVGGHIKDGIGARQACVYNPFKDEWTAKAVPNEGRWYPSALTLLDGGIFTISGDHGDEKGTAYHVSNIPQIWRDDKWVTVASPPPPESALYPRLHLSPTDGAIFVAGPQARA